MEETPDDVDLLLAELQGREDDVLEDLFQALPSLGRAFDVTVGVHQLGHSISFLRGNLTISSSAHVCLRTHEQDGTSALRVTFDLWQPLVNNA